MILEVNENIIKDASWLHLTGDTKHITLTKLDATMKGGDLALQWRVSQVHLITDYTYSPLDFKYPNRQGTHKHNGIW